MLKWKLEVTMENSKTIIIALGGSIIIPEPGKINTGFLKKFRKLILKFTKSRGYRFIIVAGGGKVSRVYQQAASKIIKRLPFEDMDWLGIHATRINAHLLRTIFQREAYPVVLDDPKKPLRGKWLIIIAAGWRPGWSTDYISVLLAKRFKVKEIIDAGNIPFVYNKDPHAPYAAKFNVYPKYHKKKSSGFPKKKIQLRGRGATAIKKISWKDYQKLVGSKWIPGLPAPIDPIAAKVAQKLKIRAIVIRGTDLKNFERLLSGKKFRGTIIES